MESVVVKCWLVVQPRCKCVILAPLHKLVRQFFEINMLIFEQLSVQMLLRVFNTEVTSCGNLYTGYANLSQLRRTACINMSCSDANVTTN